MNSNLFSLNNFNIIEDDEYYYVYRALNNADHEDLKKNITFSNGTINRIRTDRERYEEQNGRCKYSKDSTISLEEVWDHIKMHYLKETNCISLSSNANVSLDYGSSYHDEYALIRIKKGNTDNEKVISAGKYMLEEISKRVNDTLKKDNIPEDIRKSLEKIDTLNSNEEIVKIISDYQQKSNNFKDILTRFQNRQYFNEQQQLEYNKLIAKVTILELSGILPSILASTKDNTSLCATVNNAFSSGEIINYKDIAGQDIKLISKNMMTLLAIVQQLKEKIYSEDLNILEKRLLLLINNNYDIIDENGKIVITNGIDKIDCNLNSNESAIFSNLKLNDNLLSLNEIYNMTSGTVNYEKAKKSIEFSYYLALAKRESYDYAKIIESIMGNSNLTNAIINETFSIKSPIIDRGNGSGHKLCESVNIGMSNTKNNFYSKSFQEHFINLINKLDYNTLEEILKNKGLAFRKKILNEINSELMPISKSSFYAKSIVEAIDYKSIFNYSNKDNFSEEEQEKLIKSLENTDIVRLYNAFSLQNLSHEEIGSYIINLLIEKKYGNLTFKEICSLPNINTFVSQNISKFNKKINPIMLNKYLGIKDNYNHIEGTDNLNLRDYQQRIKNDVDKIYADNRRFAGIVLPTGGGKSFIAMAEMVDRKDSNIVYIAPRIEIIRQVKKHIIKYIINLNPNDYSDSKQDLLIKSYFPHLEFYCYQGISPNDEEKLKNLRADFIILDEVHHVGADTWNSAIKKLLKHNSSSKVLGITATPIRDEVKKDDQYAGDVMRFFADYLDDYTEAELNLKLYLACDINIVDAIQDGYVVCPKIVSFDYNLEDSPIYESTLKAIKKEKDPEKREKLCYKLNQLNEIIAKSKVVGTSEIIKKYIKDKNGHYILFVPQKSYDLEQSTDEYLNDFISKFKEKVSEIDSEPHIEYIHNKRGNKLNSQAIRNFETDQSNHLKILSAINMLNEGAHLEGIKGSFNMRKIDRNHLILALQHLGRVVYALSPDEDLTDEDIPVVFDFYNNYFNLDLDRVVNKSNVKSDLEKLKDIIFYIQKNGYIPSTDSSNIDEQRKALILKKIKEKYSSYIGIDLSTQNLSQAEEYEVNEILKLGKTINLWNIEFGNINQQTEMKLSRVNVFEATATQNEFINICNSINKDIGLSKQNKTSRITNALDVLDYLSEYNIEINPNIITKDTYLKDILQNVSFSIKLYIMHELEKHGIDEDYPIGQEYALIRDEYTSGKSYFNNLDSSTENILRLRKCGIFENGQDYTMSNNNGFIINGPRRFLGKNIWTGTEYDEDGFDKKGYDKYEFDREGINYTTKTLYNPRGFDAKHIHRETKNKYDEYGFDIDEIHKDTNDILNPNFFDYKKHFHPLANGVRGDSSRIYDDEGYNIDRYDSLGFYKNGLHHITGKPYDEHFFDKNDYYWKETPKGRVKTDKKYNERGFNRHGEFFERINNKETNRGQVYDHYGFYYNGKHYITNDYYDERGFDAQHVNHNTNALYDEHGFDIDGYYWKETENGREKTNKQIDEYGFEYSGKNKETGKSYDNRGFDIDGFYWKVYDLSRKNRVKTKNLLSERNFDRDGFYWKITDHGLVKTNERFDKYGWNVDNQTYRYTAMGKPILDTIDTHGFDAFGKYHKPLAKYDKDVGFTEFYGGTIEYDKNPILGESGDYDVHGFDYRGIHKLTGTKLNPNNFDIDGFYYEKQSDGTMINTYKYTDPSGWTIDKRRVNSNTGIYESMIVENMDYSKTNEYGFDADGNYVYPRGLKAKYNPDGFDSNFIHKDTGTILDEGNFDINGDFYSQDATGRLVNTHKKFNSEGWNQHHVTKKYSKWDEHGFNYMHFYRRKNGELDLYDEHGFDYQGIQRTTKTTINIKGFDRDGYFHKKVNGEYINTHSKFNDEGYDIDGYDKRGFTKNGFYKKTGKKYDYNGFFADGRNIDTHEYYDLDGNDCYGNKCPDADLSKINSITSGIEFDKRVYIENAFNKLSDIEKESIFESYNIDKDEFLDDETLEYFVDYAVKNCVKEDETLYSKEDVYNWIKEYVEKIMAQKMNSELDDMAEEYYYSVQKQDGDISPVDCNEYGYETPLADLDENLIDFSGQLIGRKIVYESTKCDDDYKTY